MPTLLGWNVIIKVFRFNHDDLGLAKVCDHGSGVPVRYGFVFLGEEPHRQSRYRKKSYFLLLKRGVPEKQYVFVGKCSVIRIFALAVRPGFFGEGWINEHWAPKD